jgi:type IV pilus assembly protein PilW
MIRHGNKTAGLTLIEMMVTMLIGTFLMIGVISIFAQSRTTYRTNDTVQRMQENGRYTLATLQPDIRLARNWGMNNDPGTGAIVVQPAVAVTCPAGGNITAWAISPANGIEATNGAFPAGMTCPAFGAIRAGSDVLVVRHAGGDTVAPANGVIQIQSTRAGGTVFNNGAPPAAVACPPPPALATVCVYNWQTHLYYVSTTSSVGAVPSLRRKTLVGGVFQDQELVPGVEDLQVQLGLDTNGDNTVDQYINAGTALPANSRVLAAKIWLMFRGELAEVGYAAMPVAAYADRAGFAPNDRFRRALVSKTIVLRNARG